MILRNLFFILLSVSFWLPQASFGVGTTGELSIQKMYPTPSPEILAHWMANFHESMPETWVIENQEEFARIFTSNGASKSLLDQIDAQVHRQLPGREILKIFSYINNPLQQANYLFIQLTPELKAQIPPKILALVYEHLFRSQLNPRFLRYSSRSQMQKELIAQGNSEALVNRMLDSNSVDIEGWSLLYVWPDIWKELSAETKNLVIGTTLRNASSNNAGLKVELVLNPYDDLEAVAKKYTGNRAFAADGSTPYWKVIQRYLKKKVDEGKGEPVRIPLENILQPFIRYNINSFTACSGPNCHNSGLSANEGRSYQQEYVDSRDLLSKRIFPFYDRVFAANARQTGDLLLYSTADNKIVHTATYVATQGEDEIVFTKNGLQKTNAYIFTTKKQVEALYFRGRNDNHHLAVFRHKPEIPGNHQLNQCAKQMKAE